MDRVTKNTTQTVLVSKGVRRLTITSLLLTIIGGALYYSFPGLLNDALRSQLQINEENDFTKSWSKNPFPIDIDIYVFGIENPDEFSDGAKAKLRQYGPYSYDFGMYKEIISFSSDGKRVKFWDSQSFHFKPETSKGQLSDKVRVLNFPVYALANMVRNMVSTMPLSFALTPIAFGFVNILFMTHGESMIKEITVGELLNGYPFSILNTIETLTRPLSLFGIQMPDTGMPDNKFGFLWTKNFTKGGPYEAYTGQEGTDLLKLISFKDKSSLEFYDEPICNVINGTEGSSLEIDVKKDKSYYVFTADLCRSFELVYQKDSWVNGIPTYRFIPNPKAFASPSKNPLNRCFCLTPENEEMCDGIFDLSRCLNGAPVAYSNPHFLFASLAIKNNVENLDPDERKHRAYIDVEPFMGAPVRGAEKIQMNALVKPIPYLGGFRNVRDTILPLIWFEKSAIIDAKFTNQLRMALYPVYVIFVLIYILFFGGMASLALIAVHLFRKRQKMNLELNSVSQSSRSNSTEPLKTSFNQSPSSVAPNVPLNLPPTRPNYPVNMLPEPLYQQINKVEPINQMLYAGRPLPNAALANEYQMMTNRRFNQVPTAVQASSSNMNQASVGLPRASQPNAANRTFMKPRVPVDANLPLPSRLTYSNTTYRQRMVTNPNVANNNFLENIPKIEQNARPNEVSNNKRISNLTQTRNSAASLTGTEFYDGELASQFDKDYSVKESEYLENNWTSINDVVLRQDISNESEQQRQTKQTNNASTSKENVSNINQTERISWSPPGAVE